MIFESFVPDVAQRGRERHATRGEPTGAREAQILVGRGGAENWL